MRVITVIAEFFGATPSRQKISATSRASGVRALARDNFKNRLSAEVADIFISLARNKNSAMTVKEQSFPAKAGHQAKTKRGWIVPVGGLTPDRRRLLNCAPRQRAAVFGE